ncbi:AlbA family DNA-binding domain-containing protein [Aureispira anguillae]|uniref:ATP-binding protein n=1 Tax=Aureispira anguillae TaxID=2864201 RepID=A0A916DPF6_9BACT|nr:ATP-binding protein [Aureispira anguillae]BDS10116.1 ATP-binding protein [Aureispira anguillae]
MEFAKKILGKNLVELTKNDIEQFFVTEQEESDIVEYKSYFARGINDHKKKEEGILKTICAFLNSNGGLLVWGAPKGEYDNSKKTKVFKGELDPVDKLISKDSFISKITNRIIPLAAQIRMHTIDAGNNKYVYVFEVEESFTKPHQFNSIYYMRLDGQTNKAPHHYVEALFKQKKYPNLGGYIDFHSITLSSPSGFSSSRHSAILNINVAIFNHSSLLNEENVNVSLFINNGKFSESIRAPHLYQNKGIDYQYNGSLANRNNITDILYFNRPAFFSEKILLYTEPLMIQNFKMELILSFGGKKSPLKESKYYIDLRNFTPDNIKDIIDNKSENILVHESSKELGSERDKVNSFFETLR